VIVGRDAIVRRALAAELQSGGIAVAAQTPDAAHGIALAAELLPAVAIVDRDERDDEAVLDDIARMHRAAPEAAILLLSNRVDDDFAILALSSGAAGFASKLLPLEVLPRVVHSLAGGDAVVTRSLTMRLVRLLRPPAESPASDGLLRGLAPRSRAEATELAVRLLASRDARHRV
jgi:DNA-binding NarL/FixJ family response regulator